MCNSPQTWSWVGICRVWGAIVSVSVSQCHSVRWTQFDSRQFGRLIRVIPTADNGPVQRMARLHCRFHAHNAPMWAPNDALFVHSRSRSNLPLFDFLAKCVTYFCSRLIPAARSIPNVYALRWCIRDQFKLYRIATIEQSNPLDNQANVKFICQITCNARSVYY